MTAPNFSGPPSKRGERIRLARDLAAGLAVLGLAVWLFCSPRKLEPGRTFTRAVGGREVHRYEARLAAGDFLHVKVDQSVDGKEVDALLLLVGPDGKEIAHADSLDGSRWDEELAAVAETPGRYLVKVSWSGGQGPKIPYRLEVKALRRANPADRLWSEALRLSQSATDLYLEPDSRDRQIARRHEALRLWRRLGDREREAIELYQIGGSQKALERFEEAVATLSRAAEAWAKVGNQDEQALVLYEIGMAESRRGRAAEARGALDGSLALAVSPARRLQLLQARGALNVNLGEPDLGLRDLRAALVLARQLGHSWAEANIHHEIGYAYRSLGRWDDAILHFTRARDTAKASDEPEIEMSAENSLGGVYNSLGDWSQAIQHFEKALELTHPGDLRNRAKILNNLALAYHRSLRIRRALELFEQALALKQLDPETEATALNNMAYVHLELGHPQEALRFCGRAARLTPGNHETTAAILEAQAIAYLRLGRYDLSRQTLKRALAVSERHNNRFRQTSVTLVQGKLARAEDDLDAALLHARRAVSIVESFRTGVEDDRLRASFLASKRDPYDFYVDTLLALHAERPGEGFDAQSLHINEMSRARSLLDLLNETASPSVAPLPEQARPLTLPEVQSQVLGQGTLLLEYALGEERSYLWAVTPDSLQVFPLPPRREIEKTARSFYDQLLARTLPGLDANDIERADDRAADLAAELSRVILGPADSAGLLQKETKILVVSDGALQYIPFSALPRPSSPPAHPVLMVEEHEIVHLPSASVLASLREGLNRRNPPARTLALIADPVFERGDSRFRGKGAGDFQRSGFLGQLRKASLRQALPGQSYSRLHWSKEEADRILRLVPRDQAFEARDFQASVATVTNAPLDQYQFLHFATHGRIDSIRPERSSLVLSLYNRDGKEQDGYLRLADVYNLRLNADLVVLSACQTALGKEMRGEGLIGLTRGFMLAGSRRVLASLWSVDDRVTAELMEGLYKGMLNEGKSPAAALRQAQRDMLRDEDWKSPYYWAGFSLQGEWR